MAFDKPKASRQERGYGTEHIKARAAAMRRLRDDGVGVCAIGGEPIYFTDGANRISTMTRPTQRAGRTGAWPARSTTSKTEPVAIRL